MKKFIFIAVFLIACTSFVFCNGISDYMESNVDDGYRITFNYNDKENMILVRNNKVLLTVNSEEEREAVLQMMAEKWFTESIDNTSDKTKAVSIYNALYDNYFSKVEDVVEEEIEEPIVPVSSVTEVKIDSYILELLARVLENGINVNIPVAEPVQKERKEYKNHVTMSASMQMYDVNYYNNVIPLGPTETTFHSNVSSFFGVSYRHAIDDNVDLGVSTGLSFTTDKSEMFLNTPITIDCRYNFKNIFTAVKVGGLVTYNENSISLIPSVGTEIGCVFHEDDISLEVSCGISSGIWMLGTGSSKSYILTEFAPIKISIVKNF